MDFQQQGFVQLMRVLIVLTYYRPHVSGLTIYVERLARALASRGHHITVLTSHYRPDLPFREFIDGVNVIRLPVAFRLSKGVIQPGILGHAYAQMLQHDIVSLHLPQAEGGALSLIANKFAHKPVVLTYHCDLQLPPGILNRAIDKMVYGTNIWARAFADKIVTYTDDFARNSPFLSRALDKVIVIPPPVEMPPPSAAQVAAMREKYHVNGHQIVGFAARLAEEKGVDYLIKSIPLVRERLPEVKYLLAGPRDNVIGENVWERLQPLVKKYQDSLEFVGEIPNREMGNFFAVCDVLTVPSVNSTESFGLVQIEAMLSGTPVVASNLPGVREPVRMTGMGEIVPLRDEHALADKIVQVIQDKPRYLRPRKEIENMFALDRTVQAYESLFEGLIRAKKK